MMSILMSKRVGIAAASVGVISFVAYCIYFDRKRRSAPDFKKRLRERRRKAKKECDAKSKSKMPDISNRGAMQNYFFEEIKLGEEMLASGDIEAGVEHLCTAFVVTHQPEEMLMVFQQILPPNAFDLLMKRLPELKKSLMVTMADQKKNMMLQEDDLE